MRMGSTWEAHGHIGIIESYKPPWMVLDLLHLQLRYNGCRSRLRKPWAAGRTAKKARSKSARVAITPKGVFFLIDLYAYITKSKTLH